MRNPTIVDRSRLVVDDNGCSEVIPCEPFTLRDLLAGQVQAAYITNDAAMRAVDKESKKHGVDLEQAIAALAVAHTDALLAALEKA